MPGGSISERRLDQFPAGVISWVTLVLSEAGLAALQSAGFLLLAAQGTRPL
jgi:hypothetical protein